ncbi:ADP-forming succinate--CoA ligase subunit beta [Aggregatilinea lenta]|uniref:ADP-forming succinate--CoA ligase subunit beta n=1 Tax=Aggregatilinea lenta TaxID=913108 RepID=UPI000E5BA2BD|nr:ADP-forming succinate--CoA ligase subunit beta [Aggregatilinea lenta]
MNLHEYQSKQRFAEFGIPIPQGKVARSSQEAYEIAKELGTPVVVKAQVLIGGRGKAGGVKLAQTPEEAQQRADEILGMDIKGHKVLKVLIDSASEIQSEIYLGVTNDRAARKPVLIASSQGGMDIEEVNRTAPEKIIREHVDPFLGLRDYQIRNLAYGIELPRELWKPFMKIARSLYEAYAASDATLAEINPLIIDGSGSLLAVDGKMSIDDNALFRHHDLAEMRDTAAEPKAETEARAAGLTYIQLDGEIGCMVNGAGLAMATMDITQLYGGSPANFLDIGGGAKAEEVTTALGIILADPKVKAILLNIFGGITRCDEVARGILAALAEIDVSLPMVVRLVGTNEAEGRRLLDEANLPNMATATTLTEAAEKAVTAARSA